MLDPQFHEEALQTHLLTRRALQTHRCVKQRNESFEIKRTNHGEADLCKFLQTTSITKYSRIYDQGVQPSRSFQPTMMQTIHHEVLTISPSCPSITKYSRVVVVVNHPSRSTHVLLLLLSNHPSRSTHDFLHWRYSDVGYWWFQIALHSSIHAMTANHFRQETAEVGLYWWRQLNLLNPSVSPAEKHRTTQTKCTKTPEANKTKVFHLCTCTCFHHQSCLSSKAESHNPKLSISSSVD